MNIPLPRHFLVIGFALIAHVCSANMGSPIKRGTLSCSAFSSRDIDILKEKINLTIAPDFRSAKYTIQYFIKADSSGTQIPLLFFALDYKDDFKVWIDTREVKVKDLPSDYGNSETTGEGEIAILWFDADAGYGYDHSLNTHNWIDMKYFETDIAKGEHIIQVEYTAYPWRNTENSLQNFSNWTHDYSFRYSLSPARYWRSFGSLEIIIDAGGSEFTTTLGQPAAENGLQKSWRFSEIPSDFFAVSHKPEMNLLAQLLTFISPVGLTSIFFLLIGGLHYARVKRHRVQFPGQKTFIVIAGSILNPFLILLFFSLSFYFIDLIIGPDAAGNHGYPYLAILLYPVVFPVYWLVMWLLDRRLKKKLSSGNQNSLL